MDCHAKHGDIDKVLVLFKKLKNYKDLKISNSAYCIVLNALCHAGQIEHALIVWKEIGDKYKYNIHPHLINAVIDCLAKKNHLEQAQNIYDTYCDGNGRIYDKIKLQMLLSMLSSCHIYNDSKRGQQIADKMKHIIKNKKSAINDHYDIEVESMNILLSNINKE